MFVDAVSVLDLRQNWHRRTFLISLGADSTRSNLSVLCMFPSLDPPVFDTSRAVDLPGEKMGISCELLSV